jgi:Flp pilus assembly protein TadG
MRKQLRTTHQKNRQGTTIVEFAIVAPIFFLVLMASFEFIRINTIRNAANNVAYAMSRQAMVSGADATNIEANNQGILQALGVRNHTITFTPAVIAADTDRVTVEICIPLGDNGWIVPRFTGNRDLVAGSTLFAERYRDN